MNNSYLAALDIGTNSFHLIIAKAEDDGKFSIADRKRVVLRLAANCWDEKKIISEDEIKKAVDTVNKFKKTAALYDTTIKAVATSTIREAVNKEYFIERIFTLTGINIEVIDGAEEARMIFAGASLALNLNGQDVFCFDIGGGSTELILQVQNKIIFSESLKLGAVRLSNMFFPDYIITDEGIKACSSHINNVINSAPGLNFDYSVKMNVGTSGTVQSAAHLSLSMIRNISAFKMNGYTLTYEEFKLIFSEVMQRKTPAERKTLKGMEAKRADIIPAGFLILKSIFELFHLDSITYSEYALREGLILSQLN